MILSIGMKMLLHAHAREFPVKRRCSYILMSQKWEPDCCYLSPCSLGQNQNKEMLSIACSKFSFLPKGIHITGYLMSKIKYWDVIWQRKVFWCHRQSIFKVLYEWLSRQHLFLSQLKSERRNKAFVTQR